jgi:two-component system, sensor histidine kinase and response regulator
MTDPVPENGLDHQFALSRVGGDEELLKEIATIFLEDYPNSIQEIRAAIAASDAKRLETSAHTLKGSVSNFGARSAVASALLLEQMGRAGQMQQCAEALEALEQALVELRADLQAL